MKILLALCLLASFSSFAKDDLGCIATDLSPIVIKVNKTKDGFKVDGIINMKSAPTLSGYGVLDADQVNIDIGNFGGFIQGKGFGGFYAVYPITIPEYDLYDMDMICTSDTIQ